uniref:tyrosine-type recombinase/integrase n=1 Tax=Alistipes sp. D31t1_170403_E11 TaxID=2787128 RepID=UPI001899DA01|nr:tyrosine-type recombinase/integrase [Alistipes sp. D31t1_170403_E11]
MSQKGQRTTAEALEYEDFIRLLSSLHEDKNYLWELYCCISFCTACRISDVLTMTWQDVLKKSALYKIEQKTGKMRLITLNSNVQQLIVSLYELLGSPDKQLPVFCNTRTEKPYSKQYINERLKLFRWKYKLPIKHFSSHTFRKTFGRYIYETMGRSMEALILLSAILRHTSPRVTMVYLGIREEEIEGIYNTIQLNY